MSLAPGGTVNLDVDAGFEHGVRVDSGGVRVEDTAVRPAELGYVTPGRTKLTLTNEAIAPARLLLLGGPCAVQKCVAAGCRGSGGTRGRLGRCRG